MSARLSAAGRHAAALVALGAPALAGCYTSQPLALAQVQPATEVTFTLTDAGRVALAPQVGPEVASVEGEVASVADTGIVLRMRRSVPLRGDATRWVGEPVVVRRDHVALARRRTFSQKRTVLAAGGVVAAIGAFVLTRSLAADGNPGSPTTRPGPGGETTRVPATP